MARPLYIYVHVPFCKRKCPYCHFYNLGHNDGREAVFVDGIAREIAGWRRDEMFSDARLATLYWGGGTPSILTADGFDRLADVCMGIAPRGETFEWTVEVNPRDATPERFASYRAKGVNRLSIGVQSFEDERLSFLGRDHTAADASAAVELACDEGFEDVSVDLMFNLEVPGRRAAWVRDLDRAFRLPITHLSLYGLTIEPGTAFYTQEASGTSLTTEDATYAAEYRAAVKLASRAGFEHYEVSSFALPGHRSRHNAAYWSGAPYLGLGPAAHSFDGIRRWANLSSLTEWADALATDGDRFEIDELVTPGRRELETLYLGLRTRDGVSSSHPLLSNPQNRAVVEALVADGLCATSAGKLVCTERGFLVLDAILDRLIGVPRDVESPVS